MVKSLITSVLILAGSIIASAQSNLNHYELQFSEFNELKVVDGINVDYECNPEKAGKVEFETTPELASEVLFEPSKGKLSIKLALRDGSYRNLPTIKVYSSYLTKVDNQGDSLVRVLSLANGPKFNCRVMGNGRMSVRDARFTQIEASILSGNGTIAIDGSADKAKLKVTGTGSIQADQLSCQEADCSVTGTGSINCYVSTLLNVSGVGTGKIYYRGNPAIKKALLSKVKLIPEGQQ